MSSVRVQKASEHIKQVCITQWIGVDNDTVMARLAMEGGVAINNVSKSMPVLQRFVVNIEALVWDDQILGLLITSLLLKDFIPLKVSQLFSLLGIFFEEIELDSCGSL